MIPRNRLQFLSKRLKIILPPFILILFLNVFTLLQVNGATITVTTALDELNGNTSSVAALIANPGGAGISLREAIIATNNTPGADIILFSAALNGVPIILTRIGNDADATNGDLDINDNLTITGNGSSFTFIQGAADANFTNSIGDKVIGINQDGTHLGLTVSITGVTIRYGKNTIPFGDPTFAYTGAGVDIFLTGVGNNISFTDCVISNNKHTTAYGGGVNIDSGNSGLSGDIPVNTSSRGTVTFTNCTISDNEALMWGGGINLFSDIHNVTLTNCKIKNNTCLGTGGVGGNGGGVNARHTYGGTITISGDSIANNTGIGFGGGICVSGAGIQNVAISNVVISGNTVKNNPGFLDFSLGGGIFNEAAAGKSTTLTNVTISNNHADLGTGAGGGGIFANTGTLNMTGGSITSNTSKEGAGVGVEDGDLTLTNLTLSSNNATTNGGGLLIRSTSTSTTVLDNVTFSSNHADSDNNNSGDGGAIYRAGGTITLNNTITVGSIALANTAVNGGGIVNTTGSFSKTSGLLSVIGNTAKNNGGGLYITGGTINLQKAAIVSNIANSDNTGGGEGGGIYNAGGTLTLNFNRIALNLANAAAASNAMRHVSGTITNIQNNWWGTNSPGTVINGTASYTPYLQLLHTPASNAICPSTSTGLTASFVLNSAGTNVLANLDRLIGLPITFNNATPAGASITAAQTTIQANGTATATYNAGATSGAGGADAIVDNFTVNAAITVLAPPSITTNPMSQTICPGSVSFTAAASGNPAPTVQWQVSTDGGMTFTNIGGATSTTYMFSATTADNGKQYHAVFTNTCGMATSTAATLTMNVPVSITTNPINQTVNACAMVTFTAAATGTPAPTVQWQFSTDGGMTFNNIMGATNTSLTFTAASSDNGKQYRAVFTNICGPANTSAATLTVLGLTLGNLVYKDVNKNGVFDGGDVGVNGVTVNLYLDNGDGVLTGADGAPIASTTTSTISGQAGSYLFSPLCPGDYIVEIPLSNFNMGGPLYDGGLSTALISSPTGVAPDPDNDVNNDDNGNDPTGGFGVASSAITLAIGTEPVNDGDMDANTNLSLDFGFKIPTVVTINDVTLAEGTGGSTTAFNFTVTRSDNNDVFNLTVNTSDGTANSGSDYIAISGGSVNFTAGGLLTATVTVLVNQDNVVENNETFNVLLSSAPAGVVIADGSGLGTINNDDNTSLTLSMTGGSALTEGSTFTFLASLTNPVQGGFKVAYNSADGTATTADNDYTAATGILTFAGSSSETQSFTVASTTDSKVELNETFTGALGAITNTSVVQIAAIAISGSPQTATINNDDGAVVSIAANVSGSEATTPQTFSISLSNPVDVPVTVNFNTSNGSATTADMDYNAVINQTVTFPANTTTTQTVNVTINNDNKVEDNELYNVAIGTLAASGRNVSLGTSSGTGTINNDDAATVTLSGGTSQDEGNTGTTNYIFTATLNNPVQGGFTVAYTTNDGTATTADNDYLINAGGLAFIGNASETKTVTVMVNGDHKVEVNETFTISLGALSNSTAVQLAAITKSGSPQTGTILNDEIDFGDAPDTYGTLLASNGARHNTVFGFMMGATIDGEDDGQPNANATGDDGDEDGVTLPGSLITGTTANVTVNASAVGKLDAWVDFNNNGVFDAVEKIFNNVALVAGNNNLSFAVPPGATPANTFSRWRFSSAGGLGPTGLATDGEVEDYQIQIINTLFSINNPTVAEGNAGTSNLVFTISRSNNSNTCSVDYAITGGTATTADNDYQPLMSGTANFTTGGSLTQNVTVVVNGDTKVELDETVIMTLSNPVNGSIQTGTGTGTITNDDVAVITITNPSINEPDAGSSNLVFEVNMNFPSDANVSFNYATADGTATLANNDYTNSSGSHTLTPGQTTKQISVPIIGDCVNEANELFTVILSSLNNSGRAVTFSGGGATLSGTGTILNEDFNPLISCPANINLSNGTDTCGRKLNYVTPVGTDDCPGPTTIQTTGFASGSVFPVGTTTNTFKVTDNTNNTATCSFTITINDTQNPTMNCPANTTRGTDEGFCKYTINGTEFNATATDNCAIAPPLTYTYSGPTSGSGSTTLNAVMFNTGIYTITWKATDVNANTNTCSFTVNVKDNELPKITCPADKMVITAPGTCTVSGLALGTLTTSDNCGVATTTNNAPGTYQVGITLVIWKVTDVNGNTATCTQKVTVIPYSCGMPTQVYHTDTTATTAKVKWLAGKCATSYELRIRVEVTPGVWGAWSAWVTANGTLQHQFTGLTPIKFYNYQVRTICGTTNSVSINDWFWTLPSFGTNLQNRIANDNEIENSIPENPMSLLFVPNPANNFTTVLIEGFEQHEKTVTMFDLYGKLVFNVKVEPKQNQLELDLTTLGVHTGVYLIRVSDNKKQKTEQLMIEK